MHGKPERFQGTVIHAMDTDAPHLPSTLRELAASNETLSVVVSDIEEFINAIQKSAKPLLEAEDVWFGDEALEGPAWVHGRVDNIAHRIRNMTLAQRRPVVAEHVACVRNL